MNKDVTITVEKSFRGEVFKLSRTGVFNELEVAIVKADLEYRVEQMVKEAMKRYDRQVEYDKVYSDTVWYDRLDTFFDKLLIDSKGGKIPTKRVVYDKHNAVGFGRNKELDDTLSLMWRNMFGRCYSPSKFKDCTSYYDVRICEEWFHFSNFYNWAREHYHASTVLDKDIITGKATRLYSPENCCFVPRRINLMLVARTRPFKLLPTGVTYLEATNSFTAYVHDGFKLLYLGRFSSAQEAHIAYADKKREIIHKEAKAAFYRGEINSRVLNALLTYKTLD